MKTAKKVRQKVAPLAQTGSIELSEWRERASYIFALALIFRARKIPAPSVDALIKEAIVKRALEPLRGWNLRTIAKMAEEHGLRASDYNWENLDDETALRQLQKAVSRIPCITSIHKEFLPENKTHRAIIVTHISGDWIFYREPVPKKGKRARRKISREIFFLGWRKRGILAKG